MDGLQLLDDEWEPNFGCAGYPILIVAPTSVLTNWQRELDTWGHFRWGQGERGLCAPASEASPALCVGGRQTRACSWGQLLPAPVPRPPGLAACRVVLATGNNRESAISRVLAGQKEIMIVSYNGMK